jgi:hypothetical protein
MWISTDLGYNDFDDITDDHDLQERLSRTPLFVMVEAEHHIELGSILTMALHFGNTLHGPPVVHDGKWHQAVTGTRDSMFKWFYETRVVR